MWSRGIGHLLSKYTIGRFAIVYVNPADDPRRQLNFGSQTQTPARLTISTAKKPIRRASSRGN
jgi:hypothetical protein